MDFVKDTDVSDDHILLSEILEEHSITVKSLAMAVGRSAPTVYRYCCGESTIPSVIWRTLYKQTGDQRIIKLITGDVPVVVAQVPAERMRLDGPTIRRLLTVRQKEIANEQFVLNIIADGAINEKDRITIEKYRKQFPVLIGSLYEVYEAVMRGYHDKD